MGISNVSFRYWAAFTDYLTLPHISHFDTVPSLLKHGPERAQMN